jgi:hypothetical protein
MALAVLVMPNPVVWHMQALAARLIQVKAAHALRVLAAVLIQAQVARLMLV